MIAGYGMLAFRDPFGGIRPLVLGSQIDESGKNLMPLPPNPLPLMHLPMIWNADIQPGEAVFIGFDGTIISRQCSDKAKLSLVFLNMFILPAGLRHRWRFRLSVPYGYGRIFGRKNQTRVACR